MTIPFNNPSPACRYFPSFFIQKKMMEKYPLMLNNLRTIPKIKFAFQSSVHLNIKWTLNISMNNFPLGRRFAHFHLLAHYVSPFSSSEIHPLADKWNLPQAVNRFLSSKNITDITDILFYDPKQFDFPHLLDNPRPLSTLYLCNLC